ncbi:hypothetical protein D3C86_1413960 [compost metagenome]
MNRNRIDPQGIKFLIIVILSSEDILVNGAAIVTRELDQIEIIQAVGIILKGVYPHLLIAILPQQQLGSLSTGPSRTTAGGPHLLGIFQKVGITFQYHRHREAQLRDPALLGYLSRGSLYSLLDAQVSDRSNSTESQEGTVLSLFTQMSDVELPDPVTARTARWHNVIEKAKPATIMRDHQLNGILQGTGVPSLCLVQMFKGIIKLIGEPGRAFPSLIQPQTGCIAPPLSTINLDSQFHHTSPCELFCSKL